ncbi:hypothetical protein VTO42DRAFT_3394 [Malbranchea cinnamomea]
MVINLTEDAEPENQKFYDLPQHAIKTSPQNESPRVALLDSFRGKKSSSSSPSEPSEAEITPETEPEDVKTENIKNETPDGDSRKRPREETSSRSSTPDSVPSGCHGLSEFYGVESPQKDLSQKHKTVNRDSVSIPRSRHPFKPFGKKPLRPGKKDFYSIYAAKLHDINGPPVTLKTTNKDIEFNFEFVNDYKLQEGVERVDQNFNAGCNCAGICDWRSCDCLVQEIDSSKKIVPYRVGRDNLIVLDPEFMNRKSMIYECSALCGCEPSCWNRVVARGRRVRLEVFETKNRGLGLRSPDRIQAGQFIDCYLGEIIDKATADDREDAMVSSASYLFSLDFFDEEDIYIVDGRKYGSVTRFMNHSCNPNCKMFPVSHNHADTRIFEMAFFALKDIPPYTELTFDYYPNWKQSEDPEEVDPDAVKCLCGEANCRGQLWPNQRKTMQYDAE